jgi:hypothetical protein
VSLSPPKVSFLRQAKLPHLSLYIHSKHWLVQ